MSRYNVDWDEIEALIFRLSHKILTNDLKFKNIYGLQRGGLIPAVMLSHQLGIPMAKGDIHLIL
jgi:hypoxanthine phosphoribosyltransferase